MEEWPAGRLADWLMVLVLGPYLSKAQYLKCLSLIVPHPPPNHTVWVRIDIRLSESEDRSEAYGPITHSLDSRVGWLVGWLE
jgi:hypothetical protein